MTKADIVTKISDRLGVEKIETQAIIEQFMKEVKNSLETGENVYLRGFGSFIIKTRAEKKGRNISKNVTISQTDIKRKHKLQCRIAQHGL